MKKAAREKKRGQEKLHAGRPGGKESEKFVDWNKQDLAFFLLSFIGILAKEGAEAKKMAETFQYSLCSEKCLSRKNLASLSCHDKMRANFAPPVALMDFEYVYQGPQMFFNMLPQMSMSVGFVLVWFFLWHCMPAGQSLHTSALASFPSCMA